MALTKDQIRALVRVVEITKGDEIDCDECLSHLPKVAEQVGSGQSLESCDTNVLHHLSICPECKEEFELLMEVQLEDTGKNYLD